MDTTTLSSRGQIVIPKVLRESRRWAEGTTFIVETVPEGILLKPLSPFPATRLEDVMGSANYQGPALSQVEIDAALASDVVRRYTPRS